MLDGIEYIIYTSQPSGLNMRGMIDISVVGSYLGQSSNQHTLTEVTEEEKLVSIKSFSLLNQFVSSSPDFWSCRCNKCAVTSVAHHSFIYLLNEFIATSWIC